MKKLNNMPHPNPPASEKTLRDEFAMAALQGIMAHIIGSKVDVLKTQSASSVAHMSYLIANAMLQERAKENN